MFVGNHNSAGSWGFISWVATILLVRGDFISWVATILLVRGDFISWVTTILLVRGDFISWVATILLVRGDFISWVNAYIDLFKQKMLSLLFYGVIFTFATVFSYITM
jgi:hypothetical protein